MKKRLLAMALVVAAGSVAWHSAAQSVVLSQDFEGDGFPPDGWEVLDVDGDGNTWLGYSGSMASQATGSKKLAISFTRDPESYGTVYGAQDNWLISPAFEVTNNAYVLSFSYAAQDLEKTEPLEVLVSEGGAATADFTQFHKETVDNGWEDDIVINSMQKSLKDYVGKTIRVAFRHEAVSTYGLSVDNVFIYNQKGPVKPTAFSVKAGDNASLEAILSWTNPARAANGDALDGLEIVVYRDGLSVATLSDGIVPGDAASWTDRDVTNGSHTYTIAARNSEGTGEALPSRTVYVGEDSPAAVGSPFAKAVDGKVLLTWTAPTKGANNGQVNLDNLTYTVVRTSGGTGQSFSGIKGLEWIDENPPAGEVCVYTVQAVNVAGESPVADYTAAVVFDDTVADLGCFQSDARDNGMLRLPIGLNDRYSVSQTIYFPSDMQYAKGDITKLVYKTFRGAMGESSVPVKIYMHETEAASITGDWLPTDGAELVYDGMFDLLQGARDVVFPLSAPYTYRGGNLVVTFIKCDTPNGSYADRFYSAETPVAGRSSLGSAYSAITVDGLSAVSGEKSSQMPSTRFVIETDNIGSLSGTVTDKSTGEPVAGASLVVEGYDGFNAVTDEAGAYSFRYLPAGDLSVKLEATGYISTEVLVNVVAGEKATKDVALEQMAGYMIKGTIVCGDTGLAADGALVTLSGYSEASATADGLGSFSVGKAYSGCDYMLTVEYPLYNRYTVEVNNVSDGEDVALPQVTLERSMIAPFAVEASPAADGSGVEISWSDPLARDVDTGWKSVGDVSDVNSMSGDYSLADYNVGHLFTAAELASGKMVGSSVSAIKAYIESAAGSFEARVWRVAGDGSREAVAVQGVPSAAVSAAGGWVEVSFDEPAEIKAGYDYIFGLKVRNADKYPVGTAASAQLVSGSNNLKWSDNPDDGCYNGYYPWCIMGLCGVPGTDSPLAVNEAVPAPDFNVYRLDVAKNEWTKVTASPVDGTSLTDKAWATLLSGTYTYGVTAVYADGESAKAISEQLSRSNDFDAGVTAFVSPVKSVEMQTSVVVKVTVTNLGEKPIGSIPVKLFVNGEESGMGEAAALLNKGESTDVEFAPVDLVEGVYTFEAVTMLPGDEVPANDALSFTLPNKQNVELTGYRWDAYGAAGIMRVPTNAPESSEYLLELIPDDALVISAERAASKVYAYAATWYGELRSFVELDPATWTVNRSMSNTDDYILDMAYDHRAKVMYGLKPDGETVQLVTVDLGNGVASVVGNTGKSLMTLACDLNSNLYAIAGDGGFYRLDASTGEAAFVGDTGVDEAVYLQSMGFDHRSGRLFWAHTSRWINGDLYEVDPATGGATLLGGVLKDGVDPTELVGVHSAYDPDVSGLGGSVAGASSFTLGYDGAGSLLVSSVAGASVEVYNSAGMKVVSVSVPAGRVSLPLVVSSGVYLAKAVAADGEAVSLKVAVKTH